MNTEKFLSDYLKPSEDGLDRSFTMKLPDIKGLKEESSFIVQGRMEDTVSTNIISKYHSADEQVNVVEVYKRTQNEKTGTFVRLVGTVSIVKKGYAPLFLDDAVTNVDFRTGESVDMSTAVAVHVPMGDPENRKGVFEYLGNALAEKGIEAATAEMPSLPDFWGPLWMVKFDGLSLEPVKEIRDLAWEAYSEYCGKTRPDNAFDYKPVRDHMIYNNAKVEHEMFKKMGLQVPVEAQAAFFSIISTGI